MRGIARRPWAVEVASLLVTGGVGWVLLGTLTSWGAGWAGLAALGAALAAGVVTAAVLACWTLESGGDEEQSTLGGLLIAYLACCGTAAGRLTGTPWWAGVLIGFGVLVGSLAVGAVFHERIGTDGAAAADPPLVAVLAGGWVNGALACWLLLADGRAFWVALLCGAAVWTVSVTALRPLLRARAPA